jgi:hypothetical protein
MKMIQLFKKALSLDKAKRVDRANSEHWAACELLIFRKIPDEVYPAS